jgi:hypothetical protein
VTPVTISRSLPYWHPGRKTPPTSEELFQMAEVGHVLFCGGEHGFDLTEEDREAFRRIADLAPHILNGWIVFQRMTLIP